jgi:hypothetical protein
LNTEPRQVQENSGKNVTDRENKATLCDAHWRVRVLDDDDRADTLLADEGAALEHEQLCAIGGRALWVDQERVQLPARFLVQILPCNNVVDELLQFFRRLAAVDEERVDHRATDADDRHSPDLGLHHWREYVTR